MSQYTRRLAMRCSLFVLILLASGSYSVYAQNAALKLALDWYPNANHLGLFMAREKGYFRQENLAVTLYTRWIRPPCCRRSAAAPMTLASATNRTCSGAPRGVPVVSVAALVPHPLNSVIALKSSGITRPRDLVGKKVGYPAIPTNEPLLGTMLKTDGARGLQDVELVNVRV
jgi:putative hydroxymethylpyrimidine transport system substrate-binding protein